MGKKVLIIASLMLFGAINPTQAQAAVFTKLVSFVLKPVTIPMSFIGKSAFDAVKATANVGVRATKESLSNISVSAGPFAIRPFDFKSI